MTTNITMELTLNTKALRATLARMKKLGGKSPGDVILELKPDALVVQWGGMSEGLDAEGDADVTISLPGTVMNGLPRALPKSEETRLTYADGRIRFNTMSLKCSVLGKKPPKLLPMNASDYAVLMLLFTEDRATIEAAGLSEKVDKLREKLLDSIERAARALDWAGISEELLARWVEAHLQAEVRGEETFEIGKKTVVMNEAGQVSLFGESSSAPSENLSPKGGRDE